MALEIATPTPEKKTGSGLHRSLNINLGTPKVTAKDRMFFTERLSLLLETGVALHPALESLGTQSDNQALAEIIDRLREDIAGGKALSEGLTEHPKAFSSTYVNLVAAGEAGGFLSEVLKQLLEMDEKREKLRATLVSSLSYPVFLIFFSVAVVVFILAVVFPKFTNFFSAIRDQLPITTVFLMSLSDILRQYWIVVIGGTAVALYAFTRWMKRPEARSLVDGLKLRIPVLKDVFIQLYLINTLRVLSLSMSNGVGLLDALAACRDVVPNRVFQRFIERVEALVTGGRGIAPGFQAAEFIPPIVRQMISTGEETGNLSLVMRRVADFYERELEKKVTTLSKMVEPIMLLLMGVLVGLIVSSLILPIFKLSRAAH
jgi:type II secretory pathway component PulF